jgi:hypothetical protein
MTAALSALDVGQGATVTGGEGQGPYLTPPGDGDDGSHGLTAAACDEMVRGLPSQHNLHMPIEPLELSRGGAVNGKPDRPSGLWMC